MSVKPKLLDIKECQWHSPRRNMRGGVCFQGSDYVTMTIGEGRFPHESKAHAHPYEQIVFIYRGECEFFCDGVWYHLDAGCMMVIPPNALHCIAPVGNVPYLDMDIFFPKRTEDRTQDTPCIDRRHKNWDK